MENNRHKFEMVAKTFQGLEDVLAEELRDLGAADVEPGRRMVSFTGTIETLYRANMCCRTALRILKPICKFTASNPDELYDRVKEYDWETILSLDKTFSIDSVVYSDEFSHSRYVTYRVKDAIVDWFRDKYGPDKRPGVRLQDADILINVHISGERVTLSIDSSGESLHKRGWRTAQTEAPINEVLAAGIILKSGWRGGDLPFVDPMCGSGTFLVEAALIATGTYPGVYRRDFAFEHWDDFDEELFDQIYNDDSSEHPYEGRIFGYDISPKAVNIAKANLKSAGMSQYVEVAVRPLSQWEEAPMEGIPGVLVTNPPYGERISVENMDAFYSLIGNKLKNVFKGYHAWIIGYRREYFDKIGLAPSLREPIFNGNLECELREYIIFEGDYKSFRTQGGSLRHDDDEDDEEQDYRFNKRGTKSDRKAPRRISDREWRREARDNGFGGRGGNDRDHKGRESRFGKGRESRSSRFDDDRYSDDNRGKWKKSQRDHHFKNERVSKHDNRENPDSHSDNPLAERRNPALLNKIGQRPTIAGTSPEKGNVYMRERRGRRKPTDLSEN